MIEKIKTVYRFKNASEVVDTLSSLNSNQRPYQYALLDPESNPVLVELRKINSRFDAVVERMELLERGQRDIADALSLLCNQTHLTNRQINGSSSGSGGGVSSQSSRGRNSDYHQ